MAEAGLSPAAIQREGRWKRGACIYTAHSSKHRSTTGCGNRGGGVVYRVAPGDNDSVNRGNFRGGDDRGCGAQQAEKNEQP